VYQLHGVRIVTISKPGEGIDLNYTYFVGENEVLVHNMCQLQPVNNSVDANKLNHIFGKAEHNLDEFVHFLMEIKNKHIVHY